MRTLQKLLQQSPTSNVHEHFGEIAKQLMNHSTLVAGHERYRLVEIEFYFFFNRHQDVYSHKREEQKHSGTWYIHGSGVDITFGKSDEFGGILIRGLQKINTTESKREDFIFGPINCARTTFIFS